MMKFMLSKNMAQFKSSIKLDLNYKLFYRLHMRFLLTFTIPATVLYTSSIPLSFKNISPIIISAFLYILELGSEWHHI
jgi:hypothetical protein